MDDWTEADRQRALAWRKKPSWERRGRLMDAVERAGGQVSVDEWSRLAAESGYSAGGLSGFFRGSPPVVVREGDDVVLMPRGRDAAAFWRSRGGSP